MSDQVTIDRRFCGPRESSNGGYCCGRVADFIDGPATVRLHAPPPLEMPMRVSRNDGLIELFAGEQRIASGRPGSPAVEPPPSPSLAAAQAASARFRGFEEHFYPSCFVCGPERAGDDGLRIFAGPLDRGAMVAAPWTPGHDLAGDDGKILPRFLWAALDCPGAYAFEPSPGQAILLGQLSVCIEAAVKAGEPCVVAGWSIRSEGRKHFVGTAVYGEAGDCRARGEAVWIEVPLEKAD